MSKDKILDLFKKGKIEIAKKIFKCADKVDKSFVFTVFYSEGDWENVMRLWNESPDDEKLFLLEISNYNIFVKAREPRHFQILKIIMKDIKKFKITIETERAIFSKSFIAACKTGNLKFAEYIWVESKAEIKQTMLYAGKNEAFKSLCYQANFIFLRWLLPEIMELERISNDFAAKSFYSCAFSAACIWGDLLFIQWLFGILDESQINFVITDLNYNAFRKICAGDKLEILKYLWQLSTDQQKIEMLKANNYEGIILACKNENFGLIKWLLIEISKLQISPSELYQIKRHIFIIGCKKGNTECVKWTWDTSSHDQQLKMFMSEEFKAFLWICRTGNLPLLKYFWPVLPESLKKEMIEAESYNGIRLACNYKHYNFLMWLLPEVILLQDNTLNNQLKEKDNNNLIGFLFISGCKDNNVEFLQILWNLISDNQRNVIIDIYIHRIYIEAVSEGTLSLLKWLWNITPDSKKAALMQENHYYIIKSIFMYRDLRMCYFVYKNLDGESKRIILKQLHSAIRPWIQKLDEIERNWHFDASGIFASYYYNHNSGLNKKERFSKAIDEAINFYMILRTHFAKNSTYNNVSFRSIIDQSKKRKLHSEEADYGFSDTVIEGQKPLENSFAVLPQEIINYILSFVNRYAERSLFEKPAVPISLGGQRPEFSRCYTVVL